MLGFNSEGLQFDPGWVLGDLISVSASSFALLASASGAAEGSAIARTDIKEGFC